MKAKDVMTAPPEVTVATDPVGRAAEIMRDHDVGFVPVVDDLRTMRLAGVITDRDIAVRHVAEGHADPCPIAKHMTMGDIVSVDPEADVGRVIDLMRREQVRRVAVTRGDRIIGVIALGDVASIGEHRADVPGLVAEISERLPAARLSSSSGA